MNFKDQIQEYIPGNQQERQDKRVMLDYIKQFPANILYRENEFAHITSSAIILNSNCNKILLIHHNIYQTWTWTGGHADGDTDLLQIALKEAKEETGLQKLTPLFSHIASLDILPVWGHFKREKYVCAHQHLNVAYILIANETEKLMLNEEETSGILWLDINKLPEYSKEPHMIKVYEKLIQKALLKNKLYGRK